MNQARKSDVTQLAGGIQRPSQAPTRLVTKAERAKLAAVAEQYGGPKAEPLDKLWVDLSNAMEKGGWGKPREGPGGKAKEEAACWGVGHGV